MPYFVPETKKAVQLLHEMTKRRVQLAIIVDEQGGTAGIVTLGDLLEEPVGEIFSETEKLPADVISPQPDGTVLVAGSTPVWDVNRELDFELPEGDDWTTVAELCLALAGA